MVMVMVSKQPEDIQGSQVWLRRDQKWQLPQPPSGDISTWSSAFVGVDKLMVTMMLRMTTTMTTLVAAIQHGLGVDDDDDNDDDADHDTNECDDIILKNIPEQASTRPRIS